MIMEQVKLIETRMFTLESVDDRMIMEMMKTLCMVRIVTTDGKLQHHNLLQSITLFTQLNLSNLS